MSAKSERDLLLGKLTKEILSLSDLKPTPLILIDGRACSGKSSFASELGDRLFRKLDAAPRLIHMDDIYPGWEGLRAGSTYLLEKVLEPLAQGKVAAWQIWNWAQSQRGNATEPGNGWREFSGGIPLIVEGCGSISQRSADLADITVWLDCELETRKQRWHERDGGSFDSQFSLWELQETEFYESEQTESLTKFHLTT